MKIRKELTKWNTTVWWKQYVLNPHQFSFLFYLKETFVTNTRIWVIQWVKTKEDSWCATFGNKQSNKIHIHKEQLDRPDEMDTEMHTLVAAGNIAVIPWAKFLPTDLQKNSSSIILFVCLLFFLASAKCNLINNAARRQCVCSVWVNHVSVNTKQRPWGLSKKTIFFNRLNIATFCGHYSIMKPIAIIRCHNSKEHTFGKRNSQQ